MRYVMTLGLALVLAFATTASAMAGPRGASGPQTSDPYRVVVPVADTAASSRGQAFATALARVMQRVSGHAPPASELKAAATYVQQYQYERAPAGATQPFQLVVRFAPAAIEHLQRTLAAPTPAPTTTTAMPGAAMPAAAAGGDLVWVSGIHSALDFADVMAALDHAPGVDSVGVRQAHDGGMLLRVRASVPLAQILAGLGAASRLTVSMTAHAGAAASLHWSR